MSKGRKRRKVRPESGQEASGSQTQTASIPSDAPIDSPGRAEDDARTWPAWLLLLPILLLGLFAYAPVVDAGFIWDDDDYVELNPLLVEEGGLSEIWNPSSPKNPQYYPLVFTTFWVEMRLWGLDPTGYHIDNVLLHLAGTALLFLLLRRVRVPGAWLVAAAFALHPVIVESVAWVAERKNVLSGVFYFLSAHAYLTFDQTRKRPWYAAALLCFFLALTAKTVTASLPIALGLLFFWKEGRIEWRRIVTLGPMIALGFVMGMLTRSHEYEHVISKTTILNDLTPPDRLLIAGRALWFYPAKVFWPKDFAFIYERWDIDPSALVQWGFPLLAAAFIAGTFFLYLRGRLPRGPFAAILFYGATIFPALGFVNVAPMRFSFVADHFQYLASIGSFLIGTAVLVTLLRRFGAERAFPVAAGVIALGLAMLTRQQVAHYHDLGTLWGHTARLSPNNPMVLNSYANWLRKQSDPELRKLAAEYNERAIQLGDRENQLLGQSNLAILKLREGDYQAALEEADRALALNPGFPLTMKVRGEALYRLGRLDEAELTLRQILSQKVDAEGGRHAWDIRRRVDDSRVYAILGFVQRDQKKDAEAVASFERALEIDPEFYSVYVDLGNWHGLHDRLDAAAETYRRLLQTDPPPEFALQGHMQLARTLRFQNRPNEAIESFRGAVSVAPSDVQANRFLVETLLETRRYAPAVGALRSAIGNVPDPADFEHRLVWVLATAPDPAVRDGAQALALGTRLASGRPVALTYSVLAAAQAETGDFAAALGSVAQGQAAQPGPLAEQLAQQQRDYQRGAPTRLP